MTSRPYIEDLVEALDRAGERSVLRRDGAGTSGRELLTATFRYARALESLGVTRGDLVALYAASRPAALAVRYATHLLGAASVYLSAPADPARREQMLRDFRPRLVVVFPETAALLPPVSAPCAAIGAVPAVPLDLAALAAGQDPGPRPSRARPGDQAVVISSGGTTGVPKGSVRDFARYTSMLAAPRPQGRRQLANGKLAYLTQALVDQTLLGGGTVILQDEFEPAATLVAIEAERVTHLFLVEPQLFELMDHPDVARRDLSSLTALTHVGAAAAPVLRLRARQRLGPVIAHTYGASEMGLVSALSPAEHDLARPGRFSSAGRILPGVEVRFRAPDGTLSQRGGTIEVRSPAMAAGYLGRPVEQAANFAGGWYRPGDLVRLDQEGYLHVDGRADDCAVVDGRLVTPVALQELLCRRPDVRYAVIVLDPGSGTRVAAAVPWPGGGVDAAGCLDDVRAAFGPALAAATVIVPLDRIPLTEQGKPDRPAIRRLGRERAAVSGPPTGPVAG
jgi:fatty-acyl-CoA synthase